MNNIEISVIIPIHNSSKFINQIYINLNTQIYKNFEVIFINDHSIDQSSLKIQHTFKTFNQPWQIVNSVEKGVSAARNEGINCSKGKYLAFIDDDDKLTKDYLALLYQDIIENKADVVLASYIERDNNSTIKKELPWNGIFTSSQIKSKIIPTTIFAIDDEVETWLPVWRTLIKKDIVVKNNIVFDKNVSQAEDFLFMLNVLMNSNKVYFDSDNYIYIYCRRSDSAMNSYISNDIEKQLYFHQRLLSILYKYKIYDLVKNRYLSNKAKMYSTLVSNAVRLSEKEKSINEINYINKKIKDDNYLIKTNFNKLQNPWFIKLSLLLMKNNLSLPLYTIYKIKENRRLKKLQ